MIKLVNKLDEQKPKGKKAIMFISFMLFCCLFSHSQNRVLTTDGKTLDVSSIEVNEGSVALAVDGETQTISKTDILCIVPSGGQGFTYRAKNGRKIKIRKKDIHSDYQGADKPRIFAYKYLGSKSNIAQLYALNSDNSITFESFKSVFNEQQKKFRNRNIISGSFAVLALYVGYASLKSSLDSANDAQNALNNL